MKAIDPVCGMSVDTERAWGSLEHEGTVYYFCAAHCAKAFAEHPEKYVPSSAAESHGHGGEQGAHHGAHGHHGGGGH